MTIRMHRSIDQPMREGLTWTESWEGLDNGLIWCWERGREMRVERPDLAERANEGELVILGWNGGVERKLKITKKPGTLKYLATWQGLRGENLNIELGGERVMVCTKTGQTVVFSPTPILDEQ